MQYQVDEIAMPVADGATGGPRGPAPHNGSPHNGSVLSGSVLNGSVLAVAEPGRAAARRGTHSTRSRTVVSAVGEGGAVVRLKRDDSINPEALFNSQYPRLAGWVRRLVDDDETAHEIASEAFTRLLSRWTRLDSPHSYLYMIATNLVRDHWRKLERERRALRAVATSGAKQEECQPAQDVDVRQLIQSLPLRQRNAFLLYYYAGFSVREVATMLGRPEGTVKADLFQARARLRSALGAAND